MRFIVAIILLITALPGLYAQQQSRPPALKEHFGEADDPVNEYLNTSLAPIRENFKKINATKQWKQVKSVNIEKGEGGTARFYYAGSGLQKIAARQFGEMSQLLSEYYLLHGKLSFVYETEMRYQQPFDTAGAEIITTRSYFRNDHLAHQLNSEDCGAPFSSDYLEEERKRLYESYGQLLRLGKDR